MVQGSITCSTSGIACWLLPEQASESHPPVSPATRLGRPSVSPGTSRWPSSRSATPANHTPVVLITTSWHVCFILKILGCRSPMPEQDRSKMPRNCTASYNRP